jgi:hypothetical protein
MDLGFTYKPVKTHDNYMHIIYICVCVPSGWERKKDCNMICRTASKSWKRQKKQMREEYVAQ